MDYKAITLWLLSDKTGASSKCILRHMLGLEGDGRYPLDGSDFARCEGLLDAVPQFRKRLGKMAEVNRYWAALVPKWDEIKGSADRTEAIQAAIRPL